MLISIQGAMIFAKRANALFAKRIVRPGMARGWRATALWRTPFGERAAARGTGKDFD